MGFIDFTLPKVIFNCAVGELVEIMYQDDTTEWKIRRFRGVCFARRSTRCSLYTQVNGIGVFFSLDLMSPLIISVKHVSVVLVPKKKTFSLRSGGAKNFGLWFF